MIRPATTTTVAEQVKIPGCLVTVRVAADAPTALLPGTKRVMTQAEYDSELASINSANANVR